MKSIEVAVTATGAATFASPFGSVAFFAGAFLVAGFFAAGFSLVAGSLLLTSVLAAGFLATGFLSAVFFSTGFLSSTFLATGFLAAGFIAVVGSTESEFSFTISGALQAVSLSGHTHRVRNLKTVLITFVNNQTFSSHFFVAPSARWVLCGNLTDAREICVAQCVD
jgi:hypothetical protein